jgi:hypothetical protein
MCGSSDWFKKNCCTEFHENRTKSFSDGRTDGRRNCFSHKV